MKIIEKTFNIITGEETLIERAATTQEIAEVEKAQAEAELAQAEAKAKAEAKATAEAKLAAFGLTAEDLKALGL